MLEACKGCGRWDGVTTYCMQPYSLPSHTSAPLDVLVVSEYPSYEDDARGVPFLDEPHKDLIALPMSKTPWHVQFTHLARCAGSKPTSAQLCLQGRVLPADAQQLQAQSHLGHRRSGGQAPPSKLALPGQATLYGRE